MEARLQGKEDRRRGIKEPKDKEERQAWPNIQSNQCPGKQASKRPDASKISVQCNEGKQGCGAEQKGWEEKRRIQEEEIVKRIWEPQACSHERKKFLMQQDGVSEELQSKRMEAVEMLEAGVRDRANRKYAD